MSGSGTSAQAIPNNKNHGSRDENKREGEKISDFDVRFYISTSLQ